MAEGVAAGSSKPAAAGAGGTLYVVATPIGNLGDVSQRALDTLRSVPLIAAEDTRMTHRLLARYEIATRTTSYHANSTPGRLDELMRHLRGGNDLALVTDAGTPAISDPGEGLIEAWASEGGAVVAIPGASAVLAAIAATGIAGPRWSFEGFLPRSGRDRRDRLARIAADERGTVLYEAPTRLAATLRDLTAACGQGRPAAICRELTKLHEQVVRGSLGELGAAVGTGTIPTRGEITIVIGAVADITAVGGAEAAGAQVPAAADLVTAIAAVETLVAAGTPRSEAARTVARDTGLPRRELYRK